jgi:hypothetical protein
MAIDWVSLGLGAYNKTMDFLLGRQSAAKEDRLVKAGRDEQALAGKDAALDRAKEQNAREEDIDRLSGDALDDRMRKSME